MKTFAIFYEANLPKGVEQLPDGTYKQTRDNVTKYALDPQLLKLHRIDGPATISPGSETWWLNGKRHRIGGPAFTQSSKMVIRATTGLVDVPYPQEQWYQNGQLHRIDGPATISPDSETWWLNGKRHRIGGPAVIEPYYEEWWVEGAKLTEEDYNDLMKKLSTLTDASDKEATIAAATMFD